MKILFISILSLLLGGNFSSTDQAQNLKDGLKCNNLIKNYDAEAKGKFWKKIGSGSLSAIDGPNNTCFSLWHGGSEEGITQNVNIAPKHIGKACMISGWVKRTTEGDERLGEPVIRVHFFDQNKINIKSEVIGQGTQDSWELLSKSVTVPTGAVRAQFKLKIGNEGTKIGGGGTAYFDNLSMSFCGDVSEAP